MNTDRSRTIRQALAHYTEWVLTNERDPDLAPLAQRFLCEYVILNADDPAVQKMWRDYAHEAGTASDDADR